MGDKSAILLKLERLSSLFRTYPDDVSIHGHQQVLATVGNTIQYLESFSQRCSRVDPQDHDSAIGTPDARSLEVDNETTDTPGFDQVGPVGSACPDLATSSGCELPILEPNLAFNFPSNPVSANSITSVSAYFDFDCYLRDTPGQDPCEDENGTKTQDEDLIISREGYNNHSTPVNDASRASRDEDLQNGPSQNERHVDGVGRPSSASEGGCDTGHMLDLAGRKSSQITPGRVGDVNHDHSRMVDAKTQTNDEVFSPDHAPVPPTKRKRGATSRTSPGGASPNWPDLDAIVGILASPEEIHQLVVSRAGKHASKRSLMRYLNRLWFHFGGPYAFHEVVTAFAALSRTTDFDRASLRGRIQLVDEIEHAHPLARRVILSELYGDRHERTERLQQAGHTLQKAEKIALNDMMACAYEELKPGSAEYKEAKGRLQGKLNEGRNWFEMRKYCFSGLWMFPSNMSVHT